MNLENTVLKASRLYDQQRYGQCIQLLKQAHQFTYQKTDTFPQNLLKLQALRFLAQAYHKKNNYDLAIALLEKINKIIPFPKMLEQSSLQSKNNQSDLFMQIHHVHLTYGQILLNYFDRAQQQSATLQQQFQLLKRSRQKYIQALKITKTRVLYHMRKFKQPQTSKQWLQKYTDDLVNLITVSCLEGQLFEDQRCYEQCFALIKKVQKFYQVHKYSDISKKDLFKCYYYKGALLRRIGRFQEAKTYLLKDQAYCQKHKLTDLLYSNWIELRSIFMLYGDYSSAEKRIPQKNSELKSCIKQAKNDQQNIRSLLKKIQQFSKFGLDQFDVYVDLIDSVQLTFTNKSFYKQLLNISELILKKHGNSLLKQHKFQITFTKSECYFKLNKFDQSKQTLDKLIDIPNQQQQLRIKILKDMIYSRTHPKEIKMIEEHFQKSIQMARRFNKMKEVENIKANLRLAKQKYQRLQINPCFQLSDDEEYMIHPYIENKEDKKQQPTKRIDLFTSPKEIVSKQESNIYNKLCLQKQIQMNKLLRDEMKNKKSQVLKEFLNLLPEHILIILQSLKNPESIDLQYHQMDLQFWQSLISLIQSKKISFDKLQQLVIYPYLQNQKILCRVLEHTKILKILKINGVFLKTIPKMNFELIHTLMLDGVGLNDISISNIPFQQMQNIKQVILINNQITARCFSQLNKIYKPLNKLNLSNNSSLNTGVNDKLDVISYKIILKEIRFTQKLIQALLNALYKCKILSLSSSSGLTFLFKQVNNRFQYERQQFPIQQIKLNYMPEQPDSLEMNSFFHLCKLTLKVIRMKFIEQKSNLITFLIRTINDKYPKNTVLDLRGSLFDEIDECKINLIH